MNCRAPVLIEECIWFNWLKNFQTLISLNVGFFHPLNLLGDDSEDTWFQQ